MVNEYNLRISFQSARLGKPRKEKGNVITYADEKWPGERDEASERCNPPAFRDRDAYLSILLESGVCPQQLAVQVTWPLAVLPHLKGGNTRHHAKHLSCSQR